MIMYAYKHEELTDIFGGIVKERVSGEAFYALSEKARASATSFNTAFVTVPRKTGKALINISPSIHDQIQELFPGLDIRGWTIDRLTRVWLLMNMDSSDREKYIGSIENLFLAAEMNELIALYSALPLFAYPSSWKRRCSEGIRNNIGDVLRSIMCNNPYPAEYLDEPAWNQLVLKAFFTEKPVDQIIGLDRRANKTLAYTLSDYAHERWAAKRTVNPQLWRCVGPFIDESIFPDILRIASSDDETEKEAAALACYHSSFPPAKELIPPELKSAISSGVLSWNTLAEKTKEYVL